MSWLDNIDAAAAKKGPKVETFWQFVKFIVVSLGACIVQVVSLAILYNIPAIKELSTQAFAWWVFHYPVIPGERCGLALFISANVANILAQIVAFFINKEKTFNSSANIALTLPIYIIFTVALIVFSAWLNPFSKGLLIEWGLSEALSKNIATMICSSVQFFLYFPVDKILFKKKKEEK